METIAPVLDPLIAVFQSMPAQSRAFMWVTIAVAGLVLLTILFSIYAVWLRVRNLIRARQWADREARWTISKRSIWRVKF